LLDAGARADAAVFEEAGSEGNAKVLALLRARSGGLHPAAVAGAAGCLGPSVLRTLLDQHLDPNARRTNGEPALVRAAGIVKPLEVRLLLDHGADVNATSRDGRTALIEVAKVPYRLPVIKLLVSRGANVNAADRYGVTALMEAAARADVDAVRYLLAHGARLDASDFAGDSPVTLAAFGGSLAYDEEEQVALVRLLLQVGQDVKHRSRDGFTPLMAAVQDSPLK